ncbi:homing endonuclease [Agrobacterium phage OLIVR5]|uniref:Homing endonuclease n=1 Tax=Agrobacterium phage OLIVR5 TaxID=2723773 RepID=A0A858MT23_9CAUD|nr:HNH endonuclease [Agrobacterium phage OLIVR5]QIW87748.1 homing endonuclease [Agrobacterium phage OLIVR5]QIW88010.1 homing endonuclease [Agrobacterium phage OLIVR6]
MRKWYFYVITYSGDKLPPFYVGFVNSDSFDNKNYHGSVKSKKWKKTWFSELEENPHFFRRKALRTFDTKKEAKDFEKEFINHFRAHKSDLFVNLSNGGNEHFGGQIGPLSEDHKDSIRKGSKKSWDESDDHRRLAASERMKTINRDDEWENNRKQAVAKARKDKADFIGPHLPPKNKGKPSKTIWTEEMRKTKSEKMKGKKWSDDTKAKASEILSKPGCFKNPEGVIVYYKGFGKFCASIGIGVREMRRVRDGVLESYKGWTRVD